MTRISKIIKLHTKDGGFVQIDSSVVNSFPLLKDTLEDFCETEYIDIILPDFTASAINHIINIVKYGSTAVITEDVGDVVEAGKLFLNIDLASGIIKKHQGGYEFEIEQGIKCRKYVCGTEELLYIWKEIYSTEILNKRGQQPLKPEEKTEPVEDMITKNEKEEGFTKEINVTLAEHATLESEEYTEKNLRNNFTTDNKDLILVHTNNLPNRDDTYFKQKEHKKKKNELHDIIFNHSDRVRLYQHYKLHWNTREEKQKYPGLIIDNEMTDWSVCLHCCLPTKNAFKNHKCEKFMDLLKDKEIEKVEDSFKKKWKTRRFKLVSSNFKQVDVDRVQCNHCDKSFFSAELIMKHLNLEHNLPTELQFICKYCGKVLENRKSIETHELREHGNSEYANLSCDLCGKLFVHISQLKRHTKIKHESARPFVCEDCPKSFKEKGKLTDHKKVHTSEKNFSCKTEGCDKAFTKEWTLIQHERIHTGVKPYKCYLCDVAFVQKNSLTVHNNTHHKDNLIVQ